MYGQNHYICTNTNIYSKLTIITNIWNSIMKHKIVINYKNIIIKIICYCKIHALNSGGYNKKYIFIHDVMVVYQIKWTFIKLSIDELCKHSIHLECNSCIVYYACLKSSYKLFVSSYSNKSKIVFKNLLTYAHKKTIKYIT